MVDAIYNTEPSPIGIVELPNGQWEITLRDNIRSYLVDGEVFWSCTEGSVVINEMVDKPFIEKNLDRFRIAVERGFDIIGMKQSMIEAASSLCSAEIISGIDIDGEHFSLTIEDQLNIASLSLLIASGQTSVPYHADGKECRYFNAEEFMRLSNIATAHKTLQESYFNAYRAYVLDIDDENTLKNIKYGVAIPDKYQSAVLKDIIQQA